MSEERQINRRQFLRKTAGAAFGAGILGSGILHRRAYAAPEAAAAAGKQQPKLRKAVVFSMLPESLSVEDQFKLARDVGFEGVEVDPIADPAERATMRAAAEKSGVRIHSIIFGGWGAPLASPDAAVAGRGAAELESALKCAKELGAENVLLVPAIVDAKTRYIEAYERSQKRIRALVPTAEKLGVIITVENVWNNFLLSPIEFARYVDEFKSPYVQAYFDVGNVVAFGWPEDWIRTLGRRIKKVHLKDFKRGPRQFCNLRDGDVDWPEVRKALAEVSYSGYLTAELGGGDEAYLRDLSARMDKIIEGRA